jgi:fermentation-respiration switch protein FrsA (DUF1100 family)
LSKFLALSALLAAPLLSGCQWLNRKLLYVPSFQLMASPKALNLGYESLTFKTADDGLVDAWWIPNESDSPIILLSHGNGGNMSHRLDKLRLLRQAGASVLMYDYRGYGISPGTPSEKGTYADGEAAWAWLVSKGIAPGRIFLQGESLGCGVAVELAARHPDAAGLILDSGFTSVLEMGRRIMPFWVPVSLLVRYRYDNLAKLPAVKLPTLVLHSKQDEIIPYELGRKNFEAAGGPKSFAELGGGHNDGFWVSSGTYVSALSGFLKAPPRRSN